MKNFINEAIIDYPVEDIFKVFIKAAKRDFPRFNKENPIGCSVKKEAGSYSSKTGNIYVEISDFKLNELYEIKSTKKNIVYTSTYKFEKISDTKTKITLEEDQDAPGLMSNFNRFVQNLCFKKRIKRRFSYLIKGLENELSPSIN